MKTKFYTQFIAVLLALALTVSSFVPASAKPSGPDCSITASTSTPVIGEPVQLTVKTSLTGPVSVYFGDNTEVQNGRSLWHTFRYVGKPVASAVVWYENRAVTACSFDFAVSGSTYDDLGLGGGFDIPEFEFEDESGDLPKPPTFIEVPVITTGDISADSNNLGPNEGENSFGFVNSGNGTVTVTIERAPEPIVTPLPVVTPSSSCSGYCASNGSTINVNPAPIQNTSATQVHTMPKTLLGMIFYLLSDGVSSPFNNIKIWLVENY